MRNIRRGFSSSLKTCGLCALVLVAIAAGTGAARAHDAHGAAAVETPPAVRAEGEDLTQSLVRLDAERRRGGARVAALALEMRDTAAERADLLAGLIADHPAEVLRLALPARLRARMPAEVQALLEERVEIEGELEVLHIDMPDPAQSRFAYFLTTELGERFSLHFAKGAPKFLTGAKISVDGLLLPRSAPDTGETDGAMAVESGETNVEYLGGDGGSSTGETSTPPILPNTFGEQRTLVIMVNFQDKPTEQPWTAQQVSDVVFGTTDSFFRENSWEQTWLAGDHYGWYTIALDSTVCSATTIAEYANAAAAASGANLASYARIAYFFPTNTGCGWAGMASVGGVPSKAWINGILDTKVVGHEFGHTLGLFHAHGLECGAVTLGANCQNKEYADAFDIMGQRTAQFGAFHKERLGWLGYGGSPPITTVDTDGTFALTPYEVDDANPKALKILKSIDPVTGLRTWYYVEQRQAIGVDSWLAGNANVLGGVIIRMGTDQDGNSSNLLDMTPGSSLNFDWQDSALTVGKSFTDPDAGVTISPLAVDASGAAVSITIAPAACIHADPAVSLTPSESQWMAAGTAVNYTVTVTNHDGATCADATFALTSVVPSGWSGTYDNTSLTLAPGASGSRTLTVTSPLSAVDGFYAVTATATNGAATSYTGSATATYVVSNPVANQPPVAVNDIATTHAGTPVTIAVLANDSDPNGDVLSVTSAGPAKYGTVSVNPDKTVTYTPVTWFVGTDSFTYSIADGKGGTASASVMVTMTNTAAVAVDDKAATNTNTSVTIRVLGNDHDPDGDPIYVKSVTQGGKGTVKINADYTVTYTPGTRFRGSDSFTYTIGDGRGGLDTATVTVTKVR